MLHKNSLFVVVCLMASSMYGMQRSTINAADAEFDEELSQLVGLHESGRGSRNGEVQPSRMGASFAVIRPVSAIIESDSDDESSTRISDMSDGDADEDGNYKENGELAALFGQARLCAEDGSSRDELEAYASGDDCQVGRTNPLAAHLRRQEPFMAIKNRPVPSVTGAKITVGQRRQKRKACAEVETEKEVCDVREFDAVNGDMVTAADEERITPERMVDSDLSSVNWDKRQRLNGRVNVVAEKRRALFGE